MTRAEEMELIDRIRGGDTELFETLVLQHQKTVYNLALRMVQNREDALDLSQEAFLKAYRSLDLFRGEASFSSWLYRLTTNVCLDYLRKKSRRPELSLTLQDEDEPGSEYELPDPTPGPQESLERSELRRAVRDGLQALPADARQILLLREIGGLSYEEIGRQLSLEEGTVKSRIFRARKKLAEILKKSGNFSPPSASETSGKEVW